MSCSYLPNVSSLCSSPTDEEMCFFFLVFFFTLLLAALLGAWRLGLSDDLRQAGGREHGRERQGSPRRGVRERALRDRAAGGSRPAHATRPREVRFLRGPSLVTTIFPSSTLAVPPNIDTHFVVFSPRVKKQLSLFFSVFFEMCQVTFVCFVRL